MRRSMLRSWPGARCVDAPTFPQMNFSPIRRSFASSSRRDSATALPDSWKRRIQPYLELARLEKPIGTWLLYWPCAWSLTMAATSQHLPFSTLSWNLLLFGTGAMVMRGAGCTINDMWDQDIDKAVDRTKARPMAAGQINNMQALTFLGAQLTVGLAILTQLNWNSIMLGASSLAIVAIYPAMKRVTYWPQFVLGTAFNWGALLGPMALLNHLDLAIYLPLYFGSIAWTIFYDTIYAHQDKEDDVNVGVRSTALLFGTQTKPILAGFGATFLAGLSYAGYLNGQGLPFWLLSVGGAAAHLAWQLRTVDLASRPSCWRRFGSNRDLGFIVWLGLMMDYFVAII